MCTRFEVGGCVECGIQWSIFIFEIEKSHSKYLDFRSNFGCLIFLDSPRNLSSLISYVRYCVKKRIHVVGL